MVKALHKIVRDETMLGKVREDIIWAAKLLVNPLEAMMSNYNVHKVQLDGREYWATDAKALNKALNQSGRGNFRMLFDAVTREYCAIAEHTGRKRDYRIIAY